MDDIFSTNIDLETDSQPPKMTKDEFIAKAKKLLAKIQINYQQHWHDKPDDNEDAVCSRCGGGTQIEQGGDIVDCYVCKGTGEAQGERVFDSEGFLEVIEHEIMFGSEPFFDLIYCEIVEGTHDVALRKPDVIKSVCECEKPNIALHPMYLTRYCNKCGKDEQTVL